MLNPPDCPHIGEALPVADEQSTSSEQFRELALGQQIDEPPAKDLAQPPLKHFGIAIFVQYKFPLGSKKACPGGSVEPEEELEDEELEDVLVIDPEELELVVVEDWQT